MLIDKDGHINMDNANELMSVFYYSSYIPIRIITDLFVVQSGMPSFDKYEYPYPIEMTDEYKKIHNYLAGTLSTDKGILYTNDYRLSYIATGIWDNNTLKGSLVAGPFILFSPESINLDKLIEDNKMPFRIKTELRSYYEKSIVVNHPRELYLLKFLISLVYSNIDLSEVSYINNEDIKTQEFLSDVIIRNRELNFKRTPDFLVQELYRYVRLGDLENARKTKNKINEYEMLQLPGIEGLRNGKILLTLFSYSLSKTIIQAGVDIEYSSNLCDGFVRLIENCDNMHELIMLSDKMLKDYVMSVNRYSITKLHPSIQKALKIINNNLSDSLNLSELSEELNLHPNYFSSLFKKEMGMTFQSYVSKLRIQEAKRLLDYSDYSILDIALQTGFKSQSHFTTIFKKLEGITPKEYRKKKK